MFRVCSLVVAASVAQAALAGAGGPGCLLIENGSFDSDLTGWTLTPVENQVGDATVLATHAVVDGTSFPPVAFDSAVLQMTVGSSAGIFDDVKMGVGEATSQLTASATSPAFDRFLKFRMAGELLALTESAGTFSLDVTVVVRGEFGGQVTKNLIFNTNLFILACDFALAQDGTTDFENPDVFVDLTMTDDGFPPIAIGFENVDIEVTITAITEGPTTCDYAETQASLLFDNFEFCTEGPLNADLNGDGSVNAADLAQLLGAWGKCPDPKFGPCDEDLDGDGTVGAADLAALLGAWSDGGKGKG